MVDDWDDTVAALPSSMGPDSHPRQAYLIVVRGANIGQSIPIVAAGMVVGRASGTDLRLNEEGVSRFHCRLRQDGDHILVEDLGSRNGTYCNGERIVAGGRALAEGDRLQIGTTCVLRFTYIEAETSRTPIQDRGQRDALTGLYSRRHFIERVEHDLAIALNHNAPLSLILVFIDRFNELRESPERAERITVSVANHIRANVNDDSMVARIADGEFAMLMRSTSPGDTFMRAERLRSSCANLVLPVDSGSHRVSFSIGVAATSEVDVDSAYGLLLAAGSALSRARSLGGDRVVMCTQDLLLEPRTRTKV